MNRLFDQLEIDEQHRDQLDGETAEMAKLWDAARLSEVDVPDTAQAWRLLEARIEEREAAPRVDRFSFFRAWPGRLVLATALAAVVLFFLLPRDPRYFSAPAGQRKLVALNDGSSVELNADSTLSLQSGFGRGNRVVNLKGEAWFSVEKADQPFIVETPLGRTTVLGTRFNVLARGEVLEVGVHEGRVEVSVAERVVVLTAGQTIRFTADNELGLPGEIDGGRFPPWRSQLLLCDRTPLAQVVAEIGRRFAVDIQILDPELLDYPVDGLLDTTDPETALSALALLIGRTYHLRNGVYLFE